METLTVHKIRDWDGSESVAILQYDEPTKHAVVRVGEYQSGTAMRGEAERLIRQFAKRAVKASLVLYGKRWIELPVRGRVV